MPAKSKTVLDLEAKIARLEAVQEAFFCLRKGETPVKLGSGTRAVEFIGVARASGGCVIEEGYVSYATDWFARAYENRHVNSDGYEIARMICKIQSAASEKKVA